LNALEELVAAGGELSRFFTPAYIAQAKAYAAPLHVRQLVGMGLDLAEYALIFGLALHVKLYAACEQLAARLAGGKLEGFRKVFARVWKGPGLGAAFLFVVAVHLGFTALALPESVYFDFLREKREGLSTYTAGAFAYDWTKSTLVYGAVVAFAIVALYALMRRMPRRWSLVLGIAGASLMLVSAALDPYRDRLVYDYKPLAEGPVRSAVVAMLAKGGVPFQNVVVENLSHSTVRADAYFAGQGPTRLIVIGDTMLGAYTPSEVAVVVAHEMGHLRESVWLARVASALGLLLGVLLLDRLLRLCARRRWFGLRTPADVTGFLVMIFAFELVTWTVGPASAWRSRARESAADAYALQLTGDPQSFITMMTKLTAQNRADPVPAGWLEAIHASHPASARRIAMALRYARDHQIALALPAPEDAVAVGETR